jgi:hypothetical protein
MKSYRLAIADAPKKNRAEEQHLVNKWRFTYALARLLDRHPALCSASGGRGDQGVGPAVPNRAHEPENRRTPPTAQSGLPHP